MAKENDRITYTELRTINIGDYESIKAHLSYSCSVKKINEKENTLTIFASDTVDVEEDKEAFEGTVKRAVARVHKVLNTREADIRVRSARFTEHDTETKGLLFKLISSKLWKKKRIEVQADINEIDELDTEDYEE